MERGIVMPIPRYVWPRRRHWVGGRYYMISVLIVPTMHPHSMVEVVYGVNLANDQVRGVVVVVRRVPVVSSMTLVPTRVDHVPPVRAQAVVRRRYVSRICDMWMRMIRMDDIVVMSMRTTSHMDQVR
jgi:hypothetical protein